MGIYIKGMKMPKSCAECPLKYFDGEAECCPFVGDSVFYNRRSDNCPLVPVPAHGRLIDADEMLKEHYNGSPDGFVFRASVIRPEMVEKLPTIIEAEEGE